MKKIKNEKGAMVIIESAIVFPIVFMLVIVVIFYGNVLFQRSRMDRYIAECAQWGAHQIANPFKNYIETNGSVPTDSTTIDVKPYRYLSRSVPDDGTIIRTVTDKIRKAETQTGFFSGMEPDVTSINVKYNNMYIYRTFEIEVKYSIDMGVSFFGKPIKLGQMSSYQSVPVSDPGNIITDINMARDYVDSNQKIQDAISKVKDFFKSGE